MIAFLAIETPLVLLAPSDDGRWVCCPNCRRRLAEWVGVRVVIVRKGILLTYEAHPTLTLDCPHCGCRAALGER